jgi:hypothetical protein
MSYISQEGVYPSFEQAVNVLGVEDKEKGECCSNFCLKERNICSFWGGEKMNITNVSSEKPAASRLRFCEDISNTSSVILGSGTALKGNALKYVYIYVMGKYGEWSFKVVSGIYKENLEAGVE